ncbi:MAG: helix-turn-helix transcriptional regulator [Clostridia bacterium]|nr:helix-turn-helix transcriptional regulator [Clostridia bacterium]
MKKSYYRDPATPNNDYLREDVYLQVNCTGLLTFREPVAWDSARQDYYLYFLRAGEMQLDAPEAGRLQAGDFIVYSPGTHYTQRTAKAPTEHAFVHFTGFGAKTLLADCRIPINTPCRTGGSPEIAAAFEALFACFGRRDALFDADSAAKLMSLLAVLGRTLPDISGEARQLRTSLDYIHAHFTEPLTVQALAAMEFLSESRYRVLFVRQMGCPPREYITALRMGLARELLYGTALSVAEAAAAAGYEDPHYFARLFRRRFGISPGSARRP